MSDDVRIATASVLVAAWLGAAALMAASVAPAAFGVLPSRALAGNVVGRVLQVVYTSGIVLGLIAVWLNARGARLVSLPSALATVVALACAIAQFIVGPRITRLRATIGPALDALSPDDARRIAFGRLHAVSVGWLGVAMLAAAAFVVLSLLAMRQRT